MKHPTVKAEQLSARYAVRRLTPADVEQIYALSAGNPLFFQYCPPFVTRESILEDLQALPPGMCSEDKFYLGFFAGQTLVALLDLILSYPNAQTAFVGLFMVAKEEQGRGTGTRIIQECADCLQSWNYQWVRLCFAKGNPQSEAFWRKNGFQRTGTERDRGSYTAVVMQKSLAQAEKTKQKEDCTQL